ncbi:hypothetical protein N8777_03900 [Candidatus Pelagibacter sp.]|nr:hypothetical protein [Candidatus Pelagibacter sp.]
MSTIIQIKKSKFWFYFLKIIFIPIYDFFWKNIINIHGRVLYFLWFKKKRTFFDLNKNDGVLKINDSELFKKISSEVLNGCKAELIQNTEIAIKKNPQDSVNLSNVGHHKYFLNIYDGLDFEVKKKIVDFASSEVMISTAAKYLRVFPILSKIVLTYNIPRNFDEKRGAMMFHKDEYGYKSMDIFIAINDIDEETGPLKAIKSKFDNLGPFARIFSEDKSMKAGNRGKVEDKNILTNNTISEMITIEGKSGTSILIDSFKCYHAGGQCKSKSRLLLRILYSTIDSTALTEIGKFKDQILFDEYVKNIADKDTFKKFFYIKRSKFFENKKFGKFLNKYYRALSFRY